MKLLDLVNSMTEGYEEDLDIVPTGLNPGMWEKYHSVIKDNVKKFVKVGCHVVKIDPNNAFYDYLTLKYKDYVFTIGLEYLTYTLDAIFAKFGKIIDAIDNYEGTRDVWYSDINRSVEFLKLSNSKHKELAYIIITKALRNKKVWVHG